MRMHRLVRELDATDAGLEAPQTITQRSTQQTVTLCQPWYITRYQRQ